MKRIGSASACAGASNQMTRMASASNSAVNGNGLTDVASSFARPPARGAYPDRLRGQRGSDRAAYDAYRLRRRELCGQKLKAELEPPGRWNLQIILCSETAKDFKLLPRHWVMNRMSTSLKRGQSLTEDVKVSVEISAARIILAHIQALT
jgi:hypothetical protein